MSPSSSPATASLPLTVAAMLATQTVTVLLFMTIPVMATEIAPAFGVASRDIALFVSIVFVSAMFFSAASGSFIHRYGAVRAIQLGLSLSALCLLLALSASLPLLYVAAALVGLGYGPNTPAGSHVLARVTPPRARSLVFSLKQSGAPLGGLLAGLLVPTLVHALGWRGAIVCAVSLALAAVVAVQPLRAALDDDRAPDAAIALASPWHAVAAVMRDARLRRLLLVAFCLTATQATVMTFVVIYLVEVLGFGLKPAGALFAASQAGGAVLRVFMGWAADRVGARVILAVLGLGSALGLVLLALLDGASAQGVVAAVVVIGCALGFGWNGVFLAEVASNPGPVGIGAATGGSLFFLYGGLVLGPAAVSALVSASGSYAVAFGVVAGATALASLNLLCRQASPR